MYYVTNQQMNLNKMYFTIYYCSPTCFSCFCDLHQDVVQEYKQYANVIVYSYIVRIDILIEGVLERKIKKMLRHGEFF